MRGLLFCEKGNWKNALQDLEKANSLKSKGIERIPLILFEIKMKIIEEK